MRRFFNWYQFLAPIIALPLAYYLWWQRLAHNHAVTLLVLALPIISHYIVPALGTNYFGLWEFNTRIRLGKFRPHHGFVFGSVMSLFGLVCYGGSTPTFGWLEMLRMALITSALMGFWNWIYDIQAIASGFVTVYNRKWANFGSPEEIATDYAPLFFGSFGFCYGMVLPLIERLLITEGRNDLYWPVFAGSLLLCLCTPSLLYMGNYYLRTRTLGIKPCQRSKNDTSR